MPPYNLAAMNDDYQDVRVVSENKEYVELEVIAYPLNTNGEAITENRNWRQDAAAMEQYLAAGVTTNWDDELRTSLLAELEQAGIHLDRLTDKQVVEQVSKWFYKRASFRNMFCTYFVHFPGGKPAVFPGLDSAFQVNKGDQAWTDEVQFASELLGKSMFDRKIYGTCTSAAVAQATVLRACGIPTRIILTIPVVDASDDEPVQAGRAGAHAPWRSLDRPDGPHGLRRQLRQPYVSGGVRGPPLAQAQLLRAGTEHSRPKILWFDDSRTYVQRPERGQPGADLGSPLRAPSARRGVSAQQPVPDDGPG